MVNKQIQMESFDLAHEMRAQTIASSVGTNAVAYQSFGGLRSVVEAILNDFDGDYPKFYRGFVGELD